MTTIADCIARVADAHGLSPSDLVAGPRARRLSWPRHEAVYVAYRATRKSLNQIARRFGYADHTSVLHGINRIRERMARDDALRRRVNSIAADLAGSRLDFGGGL